MSDDKRSGRLHPIRNYGKEAWDRIRAQNEAAEAALTEEDRAELDRLTRAVKDAERALAKFRRAKGIQPSL